LVLATLLGLMLGLMALQEGRDTLTLASIGFVVLASFLAADLGATINLPRVTGYILAGATLGPHVANVLSNQVVGDIKMFNDLALGLIAVSAGLELDVKSLRRVFRTLLLTTLLKVALGITLVGGLLYALELGFGILTHGDSARAFALALVFGVLSIGTSPAIALAVMTETRAKGRMPELVLGAAVLKDLVVVICLAVALAVAGSHFQAAAEHSILRTLAIELGASVVAGALLGVVYILYLRFVKAEMLLFVAATILLVAELSSALHLELLLVFIAAGFVVRNFSRLAHDLLHPVEMVALPVFVVFFTTAGAAIDLPTMLKLLPLAGALVAMRAGVFVLASRYGGLWGGETDSVQRRAWLGYLPQAGVTLGLVGHAAKELAPVGPEILSLGTATVALNLLIGPITLRRLLTTPDDASSPSPVASHSSKPPSMPLPEELAREVEAACERIRREADIFAESVDARLAAGCEEHLGPGISGEFTLQDVERAFGKDAWPRVTEVAQSLLAFLRAAQAAVQATPHTVLVRLQSSDFHFRRHDKSGVRARLLLRRIGSWLIPRWRRRVVPLRLFLRTELEPELCSVTTEALVSYVRLMLSLKAEFRAAAIGTRSAKAALEHTRALVSAYQELLQDLVERAFSSSLARLHSRLLDYDGPRRRVRFPRSGRAERVWTAGLLRLVEEPEAWERVLTQEVLLLQVEAVVWRTRHRVRGHLAGLAAELDPIWAAHWRSLDALRGWLDELTRDEQLSHRAERIEQLEAMMRSEGSRGLSQVVIRTSRELHETAREFRTLSNTLPESLTVYRTTRALNEVVSPEDLSRHTVFPRQEYLESLVDELIPAIEVAVEQLSERSDRLTQAVGEGQALLLESLQDTDRSASMTLALARSERQRVQELLDELDTLQVRWEESFAEVVQRGFQRLSDSLTRSTAAALIARHRSRLVRELLRVRSFVVRASRALFRTTLLPIIAVARQANRALELPAGLRAGAPRQARDCAEEIGRWRTPFDRLSPPYKKLFTGEPLHEPKLLVGRDHELREILEIEKARAGGASVLLEGEPGSGRTSLFNVLQLQLVATRVLRLENPKSERVSWRQVLADTLGCTPRLSHVRRELERVTTTVLLDDLEEWISSDPDAMRQDLEELSSLVVATRHSTCWIVSVGSDAHRLYREVSGLDQSFFKTIALGPLEPDQVAELVERRHRRSGLSLSYEPTVVTRWVGRLKGADARSVFLRYLTRVTEGNPSRTLVTWCNQLHVEGASAREAVDLRWSLGLQFITRFGPLEVAILLQLSRYRRLTFEDLSRTLHCTRVELTRTLAFLEMARLVTSERWKTTWYTIDPWLRPLVYHALPRGLMRG
jgi:Kef-type K+ transport system membrane component KefB